MAVLLVIALAVLGVGMIVVGLIAMRDEPPRWMLRIKHPGRIFLLGFVPVIAALILNSLRWSIEEEISNDTGQTAKCSKVGSLEIQGEERQVYSCIADTAGGVHIGCYARIGDRAVEVTREATRPGAFDGDKPDC